MSLLNHILIKSMIAAGYLSLGRMNRAEHSGLEINKKLLFSILWHNRNSEFGKAHGFRSIRSIDDFRKNVPLSEYKDYDQAVSRMMQGHKNILTSYSVKSFAKTSGSTGQLKYIPITRPHINAYLRYTLTRALALADIRYREQYKRPLPTGKIFGALGSENKKANGISYNNIADLGARRLRFIYPQILTLPLNTLLPMEGNGFAYCYARFSLAEENTAYFFAVFNSVCVNVTDYIIKNREMLLKDIENGTIDESIDLAPSIRRKLEKKIKPLPKRANFLREQFEKGKDPGLVRRIWPNMMVYSAIGTASFSPNKHIVDSYAGNVWHDNLIYGASEGLFAAADKLDSDRYLLLADSCFYEFIPDGEENASPLLLDELEVGKEYEIVITNQAGLYRYRIGDIVRILGYKGETPYLTLSHRRGLLINVCGEKTTEEEMQQVINLLEKESGCSIQNWAVCVDIKGLIRRYMILVENEQGRDLSTYSEWIHSQIARTNTRYGELISCIDPAIIINQRPGTHEQWRELRIRNGANANQYKPVHILNTDEKLDFFLSRIL